MVLEHINETSIHIAVLACRRSSIIEVRKSISNIDSVGKLLTQDSSGRTRLGGVLGPVPDTSF